MNQPAAVRLSNCQFNVMREAQDQNGISLSRMLHLKQTTVGGIFRRGFFHWSRRDQCFRLTEAGGIVMKQFAYTDVTRLDSTRPLSKFAPPEYSGKSVASTTSRIPAKKKGKAA